MATPARDYQAIHRIADKLEPSLKRRFLEAVRQLQGRVSFAEIERALRSGALTIELTQLLNSLPRELRPAVRVMNDAFAQAAKVTIGRGDLQLRGAFNLTNPLAVHAADTGTALLVREVTRETQRSLQQIIRRSIVEGIPPREAARLIKPLIGLTTKQADAVFTRWLQKGDAAAGRYAETLLRHRARTIARTETIRASVDGQLAVWQQAQAQGLLPNHARKRWITTPDDRLCPVCAPMHGLEVPLHQDFPGGVSGPPRHPNCLPGDALVAASGRIAAVSERPFEGDLLVVSTASGKRLACTANHPILTPRGWLAARLLNVGNDVIGQAQMQRVFGGHDHREHEPTRIEQVAKAFRRSLQVSSVEVPVSAEDFHGDGEGSEVAVIGADRLLVDDVDAAFFEQSSDASFDWADVQAQAFDGLRVGDLGRERFVSAPHCDVCGSNLRGAHFGRHLSPLHPLGLAAPAWRNPALDEASPDAVPVDSHLARELQFGAAGEVFADQVIDVDLLSRCHVPVFNMETEQGWYVASGIVTHNCRCAVVIAAVSQRQVA
jgi:hypothetical protein